MSTCPRRGGERAEEKTKGFPQNEGTEKGKRPSMGETMPVHRSMKRCVNAFAKMVGTLGAPLTFFTFLHF